MKGKTSIVKFLFLGIINLTFLNLINAQEREWLTHYEKSDYRETPRYDETISYCKQLADHSDWIEYSTFGKSPQQRDLPLLILSKNQHFTPEEVRMANEAVVMIQACIHPGESEGKDAGMMLFRDLAIFQKNPDILSNTNILFIPIFNVDGHERWSKYSRINQNGPEEMGWRVTAQNLNLNRDYMKVQAPEMQAWMQLFHSWMPDFFIDCHTTDGADYQYVLTYAMEIHGNMDENVSAWQSEKYIPDMEKHMFSMDYPVFPYVQFRTWHDPRSGLRSGVSTPMISQGYTALINRPGLLIETHMLKPYQPRVESTYELLKFSIEYVNTNHNELLALIKMADEKSILLKGKEDFPVDFHISAKDSVMVDFLGIDYKTGISDLTGFNWFQYGNEAKTFHLPLFNTSVPSAKVQVPTAYIIPAEWSEVIDVINHHDIHFRRLESDTLLEVNSYLFTSVHFQEKPYEGEHRVRVQNQEPITEERFFSEGSVYIPLNQSKARLITYLLEPKADNSLLSWGFFNTVFEQKEYAETYVMEKMAREMIKENPKLLAEFEQKKKEDPDFTKSQWTMTNWFYERTSYFDNKLNKYPVGIIY